MTTTIRKAIPHSELIEYLKANRPTPTPVVPQNLIAVSTINTMLGSQPGAHGDDPGARPDAGGSYVSPDYTAPETERADSSQDGQTNESLGGKFVPPSPLDPANVEDPSAPPVIEYPEGEPVEDWRRDELDAYALNVKGLDTTNKTDFPKKSDVLAAINAPQGA